jgi:hypothetical protein
MDRSHHPKTQPDAKLDRGRDLDVVSFLLFLHGVILLWNRR